MVICRILSDVDVLCNKKWKTCAQMRNDILADGHCLVNKREDQKQRYLCQKRLFFAEKCVKRFQMAGIILESFPNFDPKEVERSCATESNLSAWSGLRLHCLVREGRDACAADSFMMILAHFAGT
jgi:hypothetical protein